MSENRLPDYLDHMYQAATDACGFVAMERLLYAHNKSDYFEFFAFVAFAGHRRS